MHNWLRPLWIVWLTISALVNTAASGLSHEVADLAIPQASSKRSAPGMAHTTTINQHTESQLHNADSSDPSSTHLKSALLDKTKQKVEGDSRAFDSEHSQQLPSLLPGIEHYDNISHCFSSSFGALVLVLLGVAICLFVYLLRQLQRKARLQIQVRANLAKLHAEQRLLTADNEQLRRLQALEQDEMVLIKAIHDRGNVLYDENRREFLLQKEIAFVPEFTGPREGEKLPIRCFATQFADPALAKAILSDFAELLRILKSSVVLIEGHTPGVSLEEVGDYEHEVADARANLVKSCIVQLGIQDFRLTTLGLPGFLGHGKDDVVLKMVN